MSRSASYSKEQAEKAGLTLETLGLPSWWVTDVMALQAKVGAEPVDGWLGPKTIVAWEAWMEKKMSQSALYSREEAHKANLTLESLGLSSWGQEDVGALQAKVGVKPVDGWFGPKSIAAWKSWARSNQPKPVAPSDHNGTRGSAIINGVSYRPPAGLKYKNHLEPGGIPAQLDDTSDRKDHRVTQFLLHRGWAGSYKAGRNFAQKTEEALDARGLSTSHSMDIDGTIYQHFDPAIRRGRHTEHHNVQSDSLDIGGPFELKWTQAPGQTDMVFKAAIGRAGDGLPPLSRTYGTVKCWSLTPEQEESLKLFIPWWCGLRKIPLTACEDWRTFRLSANLGTRDPVTNVSGILAHAQCSSPGARVDGILPLIVLRASDLPIKWRSGKDFFES